MKSSGQAVLLILLVVAVALGLGLSIMSQSTTDIRISQHEQEAARAFSAAEAGIEDALKNISVGNFTLPDVGGIQVDYSVTGQNFLEGQFEENESAQVLLDGNANSLYLDWVDENNPAENPGNCSGVTAASGQTAASLLISVVNKTGNTYTVQRYGLNACALNASNNLTDVQTSIAGKYLRRYTLSLAAGDQLVRIRPLYNLASLQVTAAGADPLPNQAYLISSSAQAPTLEAKAIEVTRLEPAAPSIFDYVLFSGGALFK